LRRRWCSLAKLISHGQREVHQAGAVVFHLLRRHSRVRRRSHPGGQRTFELRLREGRAYIGKDTGQHEQAVLKFWAEQMRAPEDNWWGYVNNGGTEGNLRPLFGP